MNKFQLVGSIVAASNPELDGARPRLLDVGCRDCALKPYVSAVADYIGVDLVQNAQASVDYVVDVSAGLGFDDRSFDFVVALDMLEHLDDLEGGLKELLRVSKKSLIVMLPNCAYITHRMHFFLRGRLGTDKYDMRYGGNHDRHRWLPTQEQTDNFMAAFAKDKRLRVETIHFNDSAKKRAFAALCRIFKISPGLWVWASLYVLQRE